MGQHQSICTSEPVVEVIGHAGKVPEPLGGHKEAIHRFVPGFVLCGQHAWQDQSRNRAVENYSRHSLRLGNWRIAGPCHSDGASTQGRAKQDCQNRGHCRLAVPEEDQSAPAGHAGREGDEVYMSERRGGAVEKFDGSQRQLQASGEKERKVRQGRAVAEGDDPPPPRVNRGELYEETEVIPRSQVYIAEETLVRVFRRLAADAVADYRCPGVNRRYDRTRCLELEGLHPPHDGMPKPAWPGPDRLSLGGQRECVVYSLALLSALLASPASSDLVQVGRHPEKVRVISDKEESAACVNETDDGIDLLASEWFRGRLDDQDIGLGERVGADRPDLMATHPVVPAERFVEVAVSIGEALSMSFGTERRGGGLP